MMDEFLEKYEVVAGKMRPILPGTATEKLDAVRKALGDAKIRDDAESDTEADDILMPLDVDDKKDRWDCETVLSESPASSSCFACILRAHALQRHIATWRTTRGSSEHETTSQYPRSGSTPRPDFPLS